MNDCLNAALALYSLGEGLGNGSGRAVFRNQNNENSVIKVAWNEKGRYQNEEEVRLWENLRGHDRRRFAKIIAYCPKGKWVEMEYLEPAILPVSREKWDSFSSVIERIDDKYDYENSLDIGYDLNPNNCGFKSNGVLAIFDYGFSSSVVYYFY